MHHGHPGVIYLPLNFAYFAVPLRTLRLRWLCRTE